MRAPEVILSASSRAAPHKGEPLLRAVDVHLAYGSTVALAGASVEVGEGEILALTGKSGSGKTSLLYCLAGIVRPQRGKLLFAGQDLTSMDDEARTGLRRRLFGFVFQFGELVPELTLEENVALPLRLNGHGSKATGTRVSELLEVLGIHRVSKKRPSEVSGGQAQRAAVARALVHRPRVVFADEPTGSLDTENGEIVLREFTALARRDGASIVLVTHEPKVARVADRHLTVLDGRVLPDGRRK